VGILSGLGRFNFGVKIMTVCKRCKLDAKMVSIDGYCWPCTMAILNESAEKHGKKIYFAGDMVDMMKDEKCA
jgi:hypothetical protein